VPRFRGRHGTRRHCEKSSGSKKCSRACNGAWQALSALARDLAAALLALVIAVPLAFSWRPPLQLALLVYLVLRLIRATPGNRLYLVPTALSCVLWLVELSFEVGVGLSPLACALFFRTKAPVSNGSGNYGQLSSPAASA
jgi:hypothetical protein